MVERALELARAISVWASPARGRKIFLRESRWLYRGELCLTALRTALGVAVVAERAGR